MARAVLQTVEQLLARALLQWAFLQWVLWQSVWQWALRQAVAKAVGTRLKKNKRKSIICPLQAYRIKTGMALVAAPVGVVAVVMPASPATLHWQLAQVCLPRLIKLITSELMLITTKVLLVLVLRKTLIQTNLLTYEHQQLQLLTVSLVHQWWAVYLAPQQPFFLLLVNW